MISIMSLVSSNTATLHCRDWRRNNLQETTNVPKFNTIQSTHQRAPTYQLCMSFPMNSWPIFHALLVEVNSTPYLGRSYAIMVVKTGFVDRAPSSVGVHSTWKGDTLKAFCFFSASHPSVLIAGKHLIYPHPCITLWP